LRSRFSSLRAIFFRKDSPFLMQQFLYLSPEPQGQGSLRPTCKIRRGAVTTLLRKLILGETLKLLPFPFGAIAALTLIEILAVGSKQEEFVTLTRPVWFTEQLPGVNISPE
jgi:hypothetical protein